VLQNIYLANLLSQMTNFKKSNYINGENSGDILLKVLKYYFIFNSRCHSEFAKVVEPPGDLLEHVLYHSSSINPYLGNQITFSTISQHLTIQKSIFGT
jgi:hypothetical protein